MTEPSALLEAALEALCDPWIVWAPDGRVGAASRRLPDALGVAPHEVVGLTEAELVAALARRGTSTVPGASVPTFRSSTGQDWERHSRTLAGGARLETFHDQAFERQAAQRREELLGIAIHDLRAPLANVRSYAGLLLSGKMPEQDPRVRRCAEVIARNADRALRTLQMYFDAQRAETGELDLDKQEVSLTPLVQEVLASRRAAAAEKGVHIDARLPPTLASVQADRERLGAAVGALLDHALVRSPPQSRVEVLYEERPHEAWLGFVDSGMPLGPRELREAFDRDAQALKEKRLGAGFAVAVARSIAQMHGGNASASSVPGRTVFSIVLPRS